MVPVKLDGSSYFGEVNGSDRPQRMLQSESPAVRHPHIAEPQSALSDKVLVRPIMAEPITSGAAETSWAMQMKAVSLEEPSHLVKSLTGAILGCGGWVLSRGANDTGTVNMLFEFERRACVDIYGVLIGVGLELSRNGHRCITELCQCTRIYPGECGAEIASIDLEIQTFGQRAREDAQSRLLG